MSYILFVCMCGQRSLVLFVVICFHNVEILIGFILLFRHVLFEDVYKYERTEVGMKSCGTYEHDSKNSGVHVAHHHNENGYGCEQQSPWKIFDGHQERILYSSFDGVLKLRLKWKYIQHGEQVYQGHDGEDDHHTLEISIDGKVHVEYTYKTCDQSQNTYAGCLLKVVLKTLEEHLCHPTLSISDTLHGGIVECSGGCSYCENWQGSQQP